MFYIGQEVVCIKDAPFASGAQPFIRKGNTYIINGLKKGPCDHLIMCVDIGLFHPNGKTTGCSVCQKEVDGSEVMWLDACRFAPKEKMPEESENEIASKPITFEKITEENPVFSN